MDLFLSGAYCGLLQGLTSTSLWPLINVPVFHAYSLHPSDLDELYMDNLRKRIFN